MIGRHNEHQHKAVLQVARNTPPSQPAAQELQLSIEETKFGDLKAGDILLYLPNPNNTNCVQQMISFFQSLTKRVRGHHEIAHAGICVGMREKNDHMVPHIADVTGRGFRIGPIRDDQPLLIFRPEDAKVAEAFAKEANEVKEKKKRINWDCCVAFGTFFKRKQLQHGRNIEDRPSKEISSSSVCSTFVIEVTKKAFMETQEIKEQRNDYYLDINSRSTPKDLDAELSTKNKYKKLLYTGGRNYYDLVKTEVEHQLTLLSKQTGKRETEKYQKSSKAFLETTIEMESSDCLDSAQKAYLLTKRMLSCFMENTGHNLIKPTSYTNLLYFTRQKGMFRRDISEFQDTAEMKMPGLKPS